MQGRPVPRRDLDTPLTEPKRLPRTTGHGSAASVRRRKRRRPPTGLLLGPARARRTIHQAFWILDTPARRSVHFPNREDQARRYRVWAPGCASEASLQKAGIVSGRPPALGSWTLV